SQADLARRARDKLAAFEERARELRRSIEGADPPCLPQLAGSSPALRRVMELARRIARTDLPVLITGETGTGKELVARWIHAESPRGDHPFVSVNCAALPEALLEAELFGHVRGAFSGADRDHPGLLASARGGSFLFDEIAEMPLALQAKLLRLLDRKAVRPVGAVEEVEIDVRFLAATNRDLEALVASGEFRRELYFRLQGARIEVPPLRERMGDLPALFAHFATAAGVEPVPRLEDDALRFLSSYPWPGNVRELENLTLRLVLGDIDPIRADDVRPLLSTVAERGLFPPTLLRSRPFEELATALEREYLLQLREDRGGDLKAMAKDLGITLRALYKRFQRLGIPTSRHDEADGDG
ncbi:MAG TPA: sigma 54-interacting transcriptional regulator, partial [Planctomycetota bacterium]|nr:sigma 54-interacting transcriptional regulator [Planctomycetota bacterium]